jgi:patatin-like phospholipase/acyl hydrolase
MGGEACDKFDMICGTSTGAIIAFLIGLRRESSCKASRRYDELIDKIFVKGALSTPMLLFTTASYSEVPFTRVMDEILGDTTMLDTRADPRTPLVFAIASKMSSSTSKMALFRNYNYEGGSNDNFVISAEKARKILGLPQLDKSLEDNNKKSSQRSSYFSRHEGE